MPLTVSPAPGTRRYHPRSRPGTGPTSSSDRTLRAEIIRLNAQLKDLQKEHALVLQRLSQVLLELDTIKVTLKKLTR